MPYSFPDNIPDYLKNLPEGAQKIFIEVFNQEESKSKDEEKARMAGWGAVKNGYEKQGDAWVKKATEQILRYVASLPAIKPEVNGTAISEIQVFRTGTFKHPIYGKFTITDDDLAHMEANYRANKPKSPTELVVDYEHMSTAPLTKAPAAGWVKDVTHRAGELVAKVEWTKTAADHIIAKEYRFVSPEWHMHYKDKETGQDIGACLLSMALTNRPFIEGMRPVILSEAMEAANSKVLVLSDKFTEKYEGMSGPAGAAKAGACGTDDEDKNKSKEGNTTMDEAKVREALGIGPNDDIMAAISALVSKSKSSEDAAKAAQTAKEAAEATLKAKEVEADVNKAIEDHLLLPKQKEWASSLRATNPDAFKAYIATATPVGPDLGNKGKEGHDGDTGSVKLTETDTKVAREMGVTEEDMLKQKQHDADARKGK